MNSLFSSLKLLPLGCVHESAKGSSAGQQQASVVIGIRETGRFHTNWNQDLGTGKRLIDCPHLVPSFKGPAIVSDRIAVPVNDHRVCVAAMTEMRYDAGGNSGKPAACYPTLSPPAFGCSPVPSRKSLYCRPLAVLTKSGYLDGSTS